MLHFHPLCSVLLSGSESTLSHYVVMMINKFFWSPDLVRFVFMLLFHPAHSCKVFRDAHVVSPGHPGIRSHADFVRLTLCFNFRACLDSLYGGTESFFSKSGPITLFFITWGQHKTKVQTPSQITELH